MVYSLKTFLLSLLLPACAIEAAVYNVGPAYFESMSALFDSVVLQPGDEVLIHARPTPYYEKFVINAAGAPGAPVVFRGVSNDAGNRPIIDGDRAVTPLSQDYWNEIRGLVKIGGANTPDPGALASYIRIENLHLRNAHRDYSFTDDQGATQMYQSNAACIYVEEGSNIEIINNEITGCGNGIFVTPGTRGVLIESNYIHGNGNIDSVFDHNTYTEALGITFRFNRFGNLCTGCLGNNLKDRSAGLTVAYNWIQGGNRQLDLVDASGTDTEALTSPQYRMTYAYGNILLESEGQGNRQVVHYGGDSGDESRYRKGTLHFYHNTIVSTRTTKTTFIRLSSSSETCDARNNIIYVTAAGDHLELLNERRGNLILHSNWIKEGYVVSVENDGSGGGVTELDTVIGINHPFENDKFATNFDVTLSSVLPAGSPLAPGVPEVDQEYVPHLTGMSRASNDIGARGYADGLVSPTVAPSLTIAPSPPSSVFDWLSRFLEIFVDILLSLFSRRAGL